jgi:hypothetical protein
VALVRVYCGLASADSAAESGSAGSTLVAAVVDDTGRLLDVCEVSDDAGGYAKLGSLLAERAGGRSGATVAADSDDHTLVSLLGAAGHLIAIADDDSVEDFAERFSDDESPDEIASPPAGRRAVGMARALQAGALSPAALPVPRDLAAYKPVLAAHAAMLSGRHTAAVALREVLRELYPAALRAFSDPADPVALAVLNALPEPGMLSARRGAADPEAVVASLAAEGVGDHATIKDAVTALHIAISETPRRNAAPPALAEATAEAVRQAIAAVRAYDVGDRALMKTVAARLAASAPAAPQGAVTPTSPNAAPASAKRAANERVDAKQGSAQEASRPTPAATTGAGQQPRTGRKPAVPGRSTPPPPPGITPATPGRRPLTPAEAGEPFRATLTTAAINSARAERQRTMAAQSKSEESTPSGFGPADYTVPVPTPRPEAAAAPPGSRANWPLVGPPDDDRAAVADGEPARTSGAQSPSEGSGRVAPPWMADDMSAEPMLRLVDQSTGDGRPPSTERPAEEPNMGVPSLRLIEAQSSPPDLAAPTESEQSTLTGSSLSPVLEEGDDDLLIFAATRSAWFTGRPQEANLEWTSSADSGWQAAEQAAKPAIGDITPAGLPRRVPQANLVPGSAVRDNQPLRIVRDANRIAASTSGYFQGWRRGQQIGGYAVGGRPGRESAGGWDFSRDHEHEDTSEYEYRSAY